MKTYYIIISDFSSNNGTVLINAVSKVDAISSTIETLASQNQHSMKIINIIDLGEINDEKLLKLSKLLNINDN